MPKIGIASALREQWGGEHTRNRELWQHSSVVVLASTYALLVGLVDILQARGLELSGAAFSIERHVNVSINGLTSMASFYLGCLMVFLSYQLWAKKRAALYCLSGLMLAQSAILVIAYREYLAGIVAFLLSLLLLHFRREFPALPDPVSLRRFKTVAPIVAVLFYAYGMAGLWLLHGRLGLEAGMKELAGRPFQIVAADGYGLGSQGWEALFRASLAFFFFFGITWLAAMVFRPHRFVNGHTEEEHRRARELVERYGADTIAYFNLRRDKKLFFLDDRIFLAFRCLGGTAVVSGDPVGPAELVPEITAAFHNHCVEKGWRLTFLGAGRQHLEEYGRAGLKAMSYGEEAVVPLDEFTLAGRKNKTLRHAVTKWEKAGATMEFMFNAGIPTHLRHELGQISVDWRGDTPETGFSMGLGRLMSSEDPDCLLAIAYGPAGEPIGFTYLVPVYPKTGYSLDITRTSRQAGNGLNEFIFARTALFLKEKGYRCMSLHFAAFSQHYRKDREGEGSRMVRAACRGINVFLPMMSLYDFDRKFSPRWNPRYLLFSSWLDVPRMGIAAVAMESFHKLMRFT